MKNAALVLVCILCFSAGAGGQESSKAGTTAAQFLKIGVGARAMAMGEATAGVVKDPSALYWNPAGLIELPRLSLFASHTRWFADINHSYFGFVVPLGDNNRLGVSGTVLSMGKMEITTEQNPMGTGDFFEASDIAVGVTYTVRMVEFFTFGTTVKYISQSISNETATAVALDFGTRLNTSFNGIVIGMGYANFGTTMKLDGRDLRKTYDPNPDNATNVGVASFLGTESWELPVNFRVGIGWNLMGSGNSAFQDDQHSVTLAVDANHPNDGPEHASVGVEYKWQDLIALRAGYRFKDDIRSLTYGLGLHWQPTEQFTFGVDYASATLNRLGPIHILSLTLEF
jgi:long-subunit fatty acid transport protein